METKPHNVYKCDRCAALIQVTEDSGLPEKWLEVTSKNWEQKITYVDLCPTCAGDYQNFLQAERS